MGAWLLAGLLMRRVLPGVPGKIVRVAFQQQMHGALLDDVVLTTDGGVELELSIKAGVKVTKRDRDFRDSLMLAWHAHQAGRWTGIVMPQHASGYQELRLLVSLAREHDVRGFMAASAPGMFAGHVQADACRTILGDAAGLTISDEAFHSFLRTFAVLGLDLDTAQSEDEEKTVGALESVRGITAGEARVLFSAVVEIAENLAVAGAGVTYPELERRLRERGIRAGLPPDLRPVDAAITAFANRTFESESDTVAKVHLDRGHLVDAVTDALSVGNDVVVTGPPGSGKSTVLRRTVERLKADGPVFYLNGRRVENAGSWASLAAEIGLPTDRALLDELLATNARGVTVVLDAVEHIVSKGARATVNDLVHVLADASGPINLVLGVRDSSLAATGWLDRTKLRPFHQVDIGDLSNAEAAQISRVSRVLGDLIVRAPKPFLGGLKLLSMLHDARIGDEALARTPATESDLLDLWWREVLVDDSADRHDRFRIVLAAAEAVVAAPSGYFGLPLTASSAAIEGLIRDGILVHDVDLDRYHFGHDIIQDWAIVHWINEVPDDSIERMQRTLAAPGNYRAVSLFAQRLAEREPPRFTAMWEAAKGFPDQRGASAFLTALVLSLRADELLAGHRDSLLVDNGAALAGLLHFVAVDQVKLDIELVDDLRRQGANAAEATTVASELAPPRWRVWRPLIGFCLDNLDAIGAAYLPFLRVVERWQRTTPPGTRYRGKILEQAIRVLTFLEGWRPHNVGDTGPFIAYDDGEAAQKLARKIVAHSADVDPAWIKAYLHDLLKHGYDRDKDDMLDNLPALSAALPEDIVAFGSRVMSARDARPGEAQMDYLGVRNQLYFPASDQQGPFLGILVANEAAGLALVRALAQRAVDKTLTRWLRHNTQPRPLSFTFAGREITIVGDYHAYCWFLPSGYQSAVLTSALMAVETWALNAIASGRPALEIVTTLLADGASLPFLGIVVGLAYDYPELVAPLADLFAQPWLWRLEEARMKLDNSPEIDDILPAEMQMPKYKPHLAARNRARMAKRVQPRMPMRFAVALLFDDVNADARDAFIAEAQKKTIIDAAVFAEEADLAASDPASEHLAETREAFDLFQRATDPASYEDDGDGWVRLRRTSADAEAELAGRIAGGIAFAHLANIKANNALRSYQPMDQPETFDSAGQSFEKLATWDRVNDEDRHALQTAALRCACVAATFMPYAGSEASAWSAAAVRAAARRYDKTCWDEEAEDVDLMDIRVSVATGVGALLAANPDDAELRGLVLRLAARATLLDVARGLLRGILPLWERRPSLAITVLSLMLDAALRADGGKPLTKATIAAADTRERVSIGRVWPNLAGLSGPAVHRIGKILSGGVPRRFADARAVAALVPLTDRLLDLSEAGGNRGAWLEFDGAVARFATNVAVGATEGYAPLRARLADWKRSPKTYPDAVENVVGAHLNDTEIDACLVLFGELADPFLRADHSAALDHEHLSREFHEACRALMMNNFEGVVVPAGSPYAVRFTEHIGRWIHAVGGHPTNAGWLLAFLDRFIDAFPAAQIVDWLTTAVAKAPAKRRATLWREHGLSISVLLLLLVTERPTEIRDSPTHLRTAALADQLLREGISGAGKLHDAIEELSRL